MFRSSMTKKQAAAIAAVLAVGMGLAMTAGAQTPPPMAPDISSTLNFTPATNDPAITLIRKIIGQYDDAGAPISPIGTLFMIFNFAVIIAATTLYMIFAGYAVIRTGEHGEFLGKSWSKTWVPLRGIAGMVLLFPTVTGYSWIQIAAMQIVIWAIGFGNMLWSASVTGILNQQGSVISVKMLPPETAKQLMTDVLVAEACVARANAAQGIMTGPSAPPVPSAAQPYGMKTWAGLGSVNGAGGLITWGGLGTGGVPAAACGKISSNPPDTRGLISRVTDAIAQKLPALQTQLDRSEMVVRTAQLRGIENAAWALRPLAQRIGESGSPVTDAEINTAINDASKQFYQAIGNAVQVSTSVNERGLSDAMANSAKNEGFMMAGAYYYNVTRINSIIAKYTANVPPMTKMQWTGAAALDPVIADVEARVRAAVERETSKMTPMEQRQTLDQIGGMSALGSSVTKYLAEWIAVDPNNPKNAIVQLKDAGDWMLNGVSIIAAGIVAADVIPGKSVVEAVASKIPNPVMTAISKVLKGLVGIGTLVVLALFLGGISLAFYVPMAPMLIWVGSILGWLTAVLEMLVVAPLWLGAQLHPEGEGAVGKYGASGYQILIDVFLRPALMICGLTISMALADPFLRFFSVIFFTGMELSSTDSFFGVISIVVFIVLYCATCVLLVHKIYALQHIIPQSIYRWIGAHSAGDDQGADVKHNVIAIMGTATNTMQRLGGAGGQVLKNAMGADGKTGKGPSGGGANGAPQEAAGKAPSPSPRDAGK